MTICINECLEFCLIANFSSFVWNELFCYELSRFPVGRSSDVFIFVQAFTEIWQFLREMISLISQFIYESNSVTLNINIWWRRYLLVTWFASK